MKHPLGLTLGDPAGIGPEICAKLLVQPDLPERPLVLGDPDALAHAASRLGLALKIEVVDQPGAALNQDVVTVLRTGPAVSDVESGKVSKTAGTAAFEAIRTGIELSLRGDLAGIVTAPINKEALAAAEVPFPGHTEMLAHYAKADVAMMLANEHIRTVLTTIHVPLRQAVDLITQENVLRAIRLAHQGAVALGYPTPRVAVAGLNPHAGEGRLFGDEDADEIQPAIEVAKAEGINASGPWPGDTVFMSAREGKFDVVVAQYHDQGLIPVKYMGLADGVNITLGLPFVRTSPDHGTAFDIAGQGIADPSSLRTAFNYAIQLRNAAV
ncbi:MAG: 4-hydroxythreonine-4-phosphate dehydrogenase PdxA [Alphaproteobacteria bacterium]